MAISKIKSESIDLTDTGYTFGDLLVSGDLTIDTSSLTVDSTNNRVGIGTTTPSSDLHIAKSGSGIIFQTERTDVDGAFSISHTSQKTYLNTDQDYIFLMNGTEAMRIDQSRNVGIGTSDPQTYLHVAGSATILDVPNNGYSGLKISDDTSGDYNIYFDAGRNQAGTKFYFRDGGRVQGTSPWTDATPNTAAFISRGTNYFKGSVGIGTTSPSVPLDIEGSGTPININSTNSEVKKIQFENNGTVVGYLASSAGTPFRIFDGTPTELMRIDSSGNVGIGTTSPSDKLNIVNAGDVGVVIQNSNSGSATLSLLATGAGRVRSSGVIIFDTGGSTERMRIDSSGNVGIGTTSPAKELHVYASSGESAIQVEGAAGDAGLNLKAFSSSASFVNFGDESSINVGQIYYSHPGNAMQFKTNGGERMRIASDGKVGIGTNNPGKQLEVQGGSSNNTAVLLVENNNSSTFNSVVSEVRGGRATTSGAYYLIQATNGNSAGIFRVFDNGDVRNTNNSYGGISDQKLKENIVDANSQWEDIKTLPIKKYSLIYENSETPTQIGVIAQELESAGMNGLVEETIDRDEDGNDLGTTTKSVKYSVLYMKSVKALQEALIKIDELEQRISALENS